MVKIAVLDSQKQFASEIKEITEKYMPVFGIEYELRLYWKAQDLLIDLKEKEFDIFLLATDIVECSEHMSLKEHQVYLRDGNVLSINKRYLGQLRKDILNYWSGILKNPSF